MSTVRSCTLGCAALRVGGIDGCHARMQAVLETGACTCGCCCRTAQSCRRRKQSPRTVRFATLAASTPVLLHATCLLGVSRCISRQLQVHVLCPSGSARFLHSHFSGRLARFNTEMDLLDAPRSIVRTASIATTSDDTSTGRMMPDAQLMMV
jgi:hypothetical protein